MKHFIDFKLPFLGLSLLSAFMFAGCRRNPPDEPQFYEREAAQLKKQQLENDSNQIYLSDKYPWQSRKKPVRCLVRRIVSTQKAIDCEISCLHRIIHSKRKKK